MWWLWGLVLLVLVDASSSPVTFLLDPRTHAHGRFYTGSKQKMVTMPIIASGASTGVGPTPLYLKSQGLHFMWPTNEGLDVRINGTNRVRHHMFFTHRPIGLGSMALRPLVQCLAHLHQRGIEPYPNQVRAVRLSPVE